LLSPGVGLGTTKYQAWLTNGVHAMKWNWYQGDCAFGVVRANFLPNQNFSCPWNLGWELIGRKLKNLIVSWCG